MGKTGTYIISVLVIFISCGCEARNFGRRHQVKLLAVAEGEHDVQPVEKSDISIPPVSVSSENQHSVENNSEQEQLTTPRSQFQDTNRLARTRLLQRARPSCDSEVIGPEKRLTEDQPRLAKLEKEIAKVSTVEDEQPESEPVKKVKKSQKLRRIKLDVDSTSNDDESNIKSIKTQPIEKVDVQPVQLEQSKSESEVGSGIEEATITESELKKYRRSSRRKSKKFTTTTTTTPEPEVSTETSEESFESDDDLEYANPGSGLLDLDQSPPEQEGSNEETKDDDPIDGPVAKAVSEDSDSEGMKGVESPMTSSNEEQPQKSIEDEMVSGRGKVRKDRRFKGKRAEQVNLPEQESYRQTRRRHRVRNDDSEDDV